MVTEKLIGIISKMYNISNPMDWPAIDRFILLASLVLFVPVGFGGMLLATNMAAPQYLNQSLVPYLLTLYAAHAIILSALILEAFRKRKNTNDWPAFENFIIGSYILVVMLSAYLTGTHFSEGLLLIFLGVNITCTLASVNKIRVCYWFVVPTLFVMGATDFMPSVPYAQLLDQSPIASSGRPMFGWLVLRAIIVTILAFLIYLCILAMKRWVERENLYQEMSMIDGLTRLSNRSSFINRGMEEIELVQRKHAPSNTSLACIMIDLDHFKIINDTWGHHAGDEVLVAASKIMMDNSRKNDEVGRYGGEEFAILLPGTSMKKAAYIAESLRRKLESTVVNVDGQTIKVTASFGVACYPSQDIQTMSDLLKTADKALYEAKETGRNKVVIACQPNEQPQKAVLQSIMMHKKIPT
jgi:diguanylate cyclase